MGFEITKESYAGSIREISIGKGDKAVTVGGGTSYPFYHFEGDMPHKPKIAMEVWDMEPDDWPEAALAPFKDVVSDSALWAKKCVDEFDAEIIVLQLKSTDPNDQNRSAADASQAVKKVLEAVDVPLVVWGCGNPAKDEEVLKLIAQECQGANLILGPVEDANHKGIGAAAMGYGHSIISSSPIDVNLAKQVNILLENLGMPMERVLVDPTTGGLGYGMEYSFSVMERLKMAAMAQGDDKLQFPIINNLGNEIWKCKEAKQSADEEPLLGDPERRGILMEAVGAVSYLIAGSDIVIMRHPEAIRMTRAFIGAISSGGDVMDVGPVSKLLADVNIDFAALAPEVDLTIEEAKKAAPAKKEAAPKVAAAVKEEKAPAAPKEDAPKPEAKVEAPAAVSAEDTAKLKAEAEAKADAEAKAAAEAKAKEDAKAKAKADAEAAAAEKEAQLKAESDASAKRDQEEASIRLERARMTEELQASRQASAASSTGAQTAASVQATDLEKMIDRLNLIHKRTA